MAGAIRERKKSRIKGWCGVGLILLLAGCTTIDGIIGIPGIPEPPQVVPGKSTPSILQVQKDPERQRYNFLVRMVKDSRMEDTLGQRYAGFPQRVVHFYIGDRLIHEVVTEKLKDALKTSGFRISQGWGGDQEPDLEMQAELLKHSVSVYTGVLGHKSSTVANVSLKVKVLDLRRQKAVFEDIMSKSQTVAAEDPELVNAVADQTIVAIVNHPTLQQVIAALPKPDVSPPSESPSRPSPPVQIGEPGKKWAVIIGIGKYQHPRILQLKYTREDAQAVYDYLVDPRGGGFPKENVRLLLDEKASKVSILSALGTFLFRSALKNDTVFIFYAGHGAPETDYTKKESDGFSKYLVPYDAVPDDLYATAIPMSEIQTIFERIESDRLVFVADACYSGASGGRTFSFLKGTRDIRITDTFIKNLAQGRGRVIIAAADANEVSIELDELRHGIFTYYFLEGLRGKADADRDGAVSIQEVYDYLFERVARHSKAVGGNQHPVWKGEIIGQILFTPLSR